MEFTFTPEGWRMSIQSGVLCNNAYIAKADTTDGKLLHFKEFFNPLANLAVDNQWEGENW